MKPVSVVNVKVHDVVSQKLYDDGVIYAKGVGTASARLEEMTRRVESIRKHWAPWVEGPLRLCMGRETAGTPESYVIQRFTSSGGGASWTWRFVVVVPLMLLT